MTVQVEFWQLITLLIAFLGFLFAAGKLFLSQIDRRLNERFETIEEAHEEGQATWRETFVQHLEGYRRETDLLRNVEREFLRFQAELPLHYVRREDYVRGQSVIEAKLDALYNKLEVVQMKGSHHG
ncbi:hypothetical protein D5041_07830 [Verminephrobacter aporrectodeae subsp. tuberculatae]|uniref:hypothetical protein n=1 Tax=Verminephrobacter aporrectodeae TaxID=1110389 RepID=UPI0022388869|nr:hypothetical protein [Verminephrobacter aporrectodeae]MCW5223506.1 hypothetical protein [Verminephrobacter aporrectodeae subsp. tuberculatae]MCW5288971.1 hypothetical protein [Verminephrobacter aporrectodeae subsp. tuberculatae]